MYLVGIDIGGTFTDCVVIDENGSVTTAKSLSVPGDFAAGVIDVVHNVAERLGHSAKGFLEQVSLLSHGTTIGTNTIVQKRGAKVGLITTKGHQDIIHIMRGSRGIGRRDLRGIVHFPETQKPEPIVPKRLIRGISERVDCFGRVVVPLNEEEVAEAIDHLLKEGVDAIAVCFLWSFLFPDHERRVCDMIRSAAPDKFVTCSVDLVPKWGEYERTTATVLNAYIGPVTFGYLRSLDDRLTSLCYRNPLQITQCGGGTISVSKAMEAPLLTLDSGPVSGVTGSLYLSRLIGCSNVITTDMGGTSFDVGLIKDGVPSYSSTSNVNQYEYFIPNVDIQAIGAGGGSIARLDSSGRSLRVGPQSAGAMPGPVCYGRGGTEPTVTDAALVLGYLDPDNFAGGSMTLDKQAAEGAIQGLADELGLSLLECANGITKIAEFGMADLIRRTTVGKGYDPGDFVLFAFGGAGPVHAGVFARELGVEKVIVPQRETASTWCAFGAASADILHIHERVDIMVSPFNDYERLRTNLAELEKEARAGMSRDNIAEDRQRLEFSLDMRHKGQINEVEVVLDFHMSPTEFDTAIAARFYARYEQLYGEGSSFRGARLEIVTYRVRAMADTLRPTLRSIDTASDTSIEVARRPPRAIYWDEIRGVVETDVYDGTLLPGNQPIAGPAIIETPDTAVVVRPGQTIVVDQFGNFELMIETVTGASHESETKTSLETI